MTELDTMSIIVFGTSRWRHLHSSLRPIMKLLPKELVIGYGKERPKVLFWHPLPLPMFGTLRLSSSCPPLAPDMCWALVYVAAICLLRGGLVYILDGAAPIHGISSGDFHCCLSENEHTRNNYQTHCFVLSSSLPPWNYCTLKEIVLIKCLYLEFFGIFMIAMYIRTYAVSLRLTADEIQ